MREDPVRRGGSLYVLVEALEERLRDPEDGILARSILGTDDAHTIAAQVEAFVSGVTGCALFTQSVGSVFVLDRAGGERVVLKVHALGEAPRGFASLGELEAVYAVQAALAGIRAADEAFVHARAIPCAHVLAPPRLFSPGRVGALMSFLDAGAPDDPHVASTGRALAGTAARIAALLRELRGPLSVLDSLPVARLPATRLPPAHNALFDLAAPGGEWIDARAARARTVLDGGEQLVVMHSDFSCGNVRVIGGRVAAIYDMDSVCWLDEVRCVASMAVHYTYAGDPPWTWPSRDEARAFVAAYEAARGRPFDRAERARLNAAAIYAIAYTARCEHGHPGNSGAMCAMLADAPDDYFA